MQRQHSIFIRYMTSGSTPDHLLLFVPKSIYASFERLLYMDDELLPQSLFTEAAEMNTSAERLTELAGIPMLQSLVAANPATHPDILTQLSEINDPVLRRAVTRNPNAPLPLLYRLAAESPLEFLQNPVIPLLNMTQPGFIKSLPLASWASLLRFADLPTVWFQQLQNDKVYQRNQPAIWELMRLHTLLVKELPRLPDAGVGKMRAAYQKQLPQSVALSPIEEGQLFLRFVLLFPFTAPMLKEQWVSASQALPRETGMVLSMTREVGAKTLRLLLRTKNAAVLSQAARHPATSPRVLKWLASYPLAEIRRSVASNPCTPAEAIALLLAEENASTRRVAVKHPSLTEADRETMAFDDDRLVRAALATLPGLSSVLFSQLAADTETVVRASVARNLSTPIEVLSTLARDPEPLVRAAAAGNPRLPGELQAALVNDPNEIVRASLSGNARLTVKHAEQLMRDPSLKIRKSLAANPHTPSMMLETLWQTGELAIGQGLAHHPEVSPEMLTQLAQQDDIYTRVAVAANKRTPVEVLEELSLQNRLEIWQSLTVNLHTPLGVLERAADTSSLEIWSRLIHHPAIVRAKQRPLLKRLAARLQLLIDTNSLPGWLRRVFLQYYVALPLEIIVPFASSPYWKERYLVALHPRTPEAVLQTLAEDGICHVRNAARQALAGRQSPEQTLATRDVF